MRTHRFAALACLPFAALAACSMEEEQVPLGEAYPDAGAVDADAAPGDATGDGGGEAGDAGDAPIGNDADPAAFSVPPKSCAHECPPVAGCADLDAGYVCPALAAWDTLPHAPSCPSWDGTNPAPTTGKCTATAPTGEALKRAGADPDDATVLVMADGRRQKPAGAWWAFQEPQLFAGMTSNVVVTPGHPFAITVDDGYGDHVVRLVDLGALAAGGANPVASYVSFPDPAVLNQGLAFVAPNRAYVATDDGTIQAFSVDFAAKTIARDDANSLALPPKTVANAPGSHWYASGVAASPDGKRLAVAGVYETTLLVYDIDPASTTYRQTVGQVDLGARDTFQLAFDPNDVTGSHVYATIWGKATVKDVDLTDAAHPTVAHSWATDQNPQGMAFLDARWMIATNDFGDSLTLIDRVAGTTHALPIDAASALHGQEPAVAAFDAASSRLYVALAGISAIATFTVDLGHSPPTLTPAGRLPSLWWPSGLAIADDGAVIASSLRGVGVGASPAYTTFKDDLVYLGLNGGIQRVPSPTSSDLAAGEAYVATAIDPGALAGYPTVTCPSGADDFPVPPTNTHGKSPVIDHVFIIVRENKTFDGIFGDWPGAEGRADYLLKTEPEVKSIWRNLRKAAGEFAMSDNFYIDAEISSLGHVWTTYGRSLDYNERTWAMSYSRSARTGDIENGGVAEIGKPKGGSFFDWLATSQIPFDILGEGVGLPSVASPGHAPIDLHYPGGLIQNPTYPDVEKACYAIARADVRCDFGNVVYMTLPNDHTQGVGSGHPSPESWCAMNDEATGLFLDGLSHGPLWKSSLVLVTEDDPAQGAEHVDKHRTIFVAISPWVKRGYVSHTHADTPAMHKLVAHVMGLPYPNLQVANVGLPLDMFTATPDYTPFDHEARTWPVDCNATAPDFYPSASREVTGVDESGDVDEEVTRWMMRGRDGVLARAAR